MKVLLLTPPSYHGGEIRNYMPPLGISYLASVLIDNGYEVKIVDFYDEKLWKNKRKIIQDYKPDIVGISCMTTNFPQAVKIGKIARELNVPLIVYGGPHASGAPQSPLVSGYGDISVIGYGEYTLVKICDNFLKNKDFSNIPSIAYKNKNGEIIINPPDKNAFDLDLIPFPARDLLDMKHYNVFIDSPIYGKIDCNTMVASRGCSYQCIFCSSKPFGKWIGRSPKNVCDEIEEIFDKYPQEGIYFNDLLFNMDESWVIVLCEEMIRRKINKYKWLTNGRVTLVSHEMMKLLKEAGCILIAFGVEAINEEALKFINKKQNLEQIEQALKLSSEYEITPMANIIIGLPGQTEESLKQDLNMFEKWIIKYKFYPGGFYPLMVYPGTKLYRNNPQYHNHNWIDRVTPNYTWPNIPIYETNISKEKILELSNYLNNCCRELLAKYYPIFMTKEKITDITKEPPYEKD